jgi:ribose transport system permease protein
VRSKEHEQPTVTVSKQESEAMSAALDDVINKRTYGPLRYLLTRQTFWVLMATIAACLMVAAGSDKFLTGQNLFNVTRNFALIAIAVLGMTAVIITGGIDLSVGSVMGLTAMITGMVMAAGYSPTLAIGAGLSVALLVGLFNGFMVAYVKMPSFVVTLGVLSIARSQGQVISSNKGVYDFGPYKEALHWLGGQSTFGIPNPVLVLIFLGLLTGFLLRWTRWGAHVFAVGGNEKAARLTGVSVRQIKLSVYVFSALMAGIAGILMAGWLGSVTQNLGEQKELTVIAATVIGGTNLMGGSGTALGGIIGAALIEVIRNSLTLLGISTFWQGTFVGSCIIVAALFDCLKRIRETD